YAVRFNEPTVLFKFDGLEYKEIIKPEALNHADLSDVPFKYNHSDNVMIMARTRSKTLTLNIDSEGLFIRAELANTTAGRDLYELIKRGDVDRMSFAFTIEDEDYDIETHTYTIRSIDKLFDVAAVDFPAYDNTSISARKSSALELERSREIDLEKSADEKRKKELLLKLRLGGVFNE
ncbi:HK97 family phage prohead protease, partial [Staphylococcus epidermidis]